MRASDFIRRGTTYASTRTDYFYELFSTVRLQYPDNLENFFEACLDRVLSDYDKNNPPSLAVFNGPLNSMNRILNLDIRKTNVYKNFIRGYKKRLEEIGKTTNYTSPIFLDHACLLIRKFLSHVRTGELRVKYEQFRFVLLMKLWFGVRTGDMTKIRYSSLRRVDDCCFSIGSDGRKGCSSVDSPTIFHAYKFDGDPDFDLYDCVEKLFTYDADIATFIFPETDRRR